MRRILSTAAALTALGLAFWVWPAQGGDGGRYLVRAIFDNANFVVPGEEVRVAGATVGLVESVEVSRPGEIVSKKDGGRAIPGKAVIVLDITDGGFKSFRNDASCIIRPQSLIGERYIDCLPSQPRPSGAPPPPELEQVPEGQTGEGQYLLPLENNLQATDIDLVQNVMRYPYRERFRIIFSELGAGVAARGEDLNGVIRRANPALRETNRVLRILAEHRNDLTTLADNGNKVMEPLARERTSLSGFIRNAATSAQATAEMRPQLEEGIKGLPASLVQVRKTMKKLAALGRQGTPLMRNFKAVAPYLNAATENLGPFAEAGIPALQSLGAAGDLVGPDIAATYSNGFFTDLQALGDNLGTAPDPNNQYSVSTAEEISKTFGTFSETGGVGYLMNAIYNLSGSVNGYDTLGHSLRGNALITGCADYRETPLSGCTATWKKTSAASALALSQRVEAQMARAIRAAKSGKATKPPESVEDLPEIDTGEAGPAIGETGPGDGQTAPQGDGGSTPPTTGEDGTQQQPPATERERMHLRRTMARAELLLRYLLGAGS